MKIEELPLIFLAAAVIFVPLSFVFDGDEPYFITVILLATAIVLFEYRELKAFPKLATFASVLVVGAITASFWFEAFFYPGPGAASSGLAVLVGLPTLLGGMWLKRREKRELGPADPFD